MYLFMYVCMSNNWGLQVSHWLQTIRVRKTERHSSVTSSVFFNNEKNNNSQLSWSLKDLSVICRDSHTHTHTEGPEVSVEMHHHVPTAVQKVKGHRLSSHVWGPRLISPLLNTPHAPSSSSSSSSLSGRRACVRKRSHCETCERHCCCLSGFCCLILSDDEATAWDPGVVVCVSAHARLCVNGCVIKAPRWTKGSGGTKWNVRSRPENICFESFVAWSHCCTQICSFFFLKGKLAVYS